MLSSERVLARRYALAFYQSAAERGEEAQANEELAKAARALADSMPAFQHPRVSAQEKKALLRRLIGESVSDRTLRFLELLVDRKRFGLLPQMTVELGRLHDEGRGIARATVRTAMELSEAEGETLKKRLGAFIGKTVVLDVKLDPDLLAGAVVRLGDWVFDASLKGKLRAMRGRLTA
ncbi:MAG: ATP synthase F1 subunit delta [Elusimicrobiota bacterium]